jgi:hypothetical protein
VLVAPSDLRFLASSAPLGEKEAQDVIVVNPARLVKPAGNSGAPRLLPVLVSTRHRAHACDAPGVARADARWAGTFARITAKTGAADAGAAPVSCVVDIVRV